MHYLLQVTTTIFRPFIPGGDTPVMRLDFQRQRLFFVIKLPNITWSGSPQHTICYNDADSNQPANPNMLGDYFPNIFMGTIDDFNMAKLVLLIKNRPWPGSTG